jgi:hypothetical protein
MPRPYGLSRLSLVTLATLLATSAPVWGKPPEVKYFFPAGAPIGSETTLTVTGEFPDWPVEGVSEPAGLEFTAGEEKGKLQVRVPDDIAPGTYLVRLTSPQGVSSWKPIVIGRHPEVSEVEPNNTIDTAQALEGNSFVVNGSLAERQDVDIFSIELEAGETLVASLLGNEVLGSPMDAVLQVCDERGFVLQQNDDERGLDPQLVFAAPREGRYFVRLFAFPAAPNSSIAFASSADYIYRLTLTTGAFVDHALPLAVTRGEVGSVAVVQPAGWNLEGSGQELTGTLPVPPNPSLVLANSELAESVRLPLVDYPSLLAPPSVDSEALMEVPLPVVISGRIDEPGSENVARITAEQGDKLVVQVESRSLGFSLDPVVRILSPDGKKLAEMDDASRTDRDVLLRFTIPEEGSYDISVRDLHGHGGLRYSYRATIHHESPAFALSTPKDALVVKQGEAVELPIDIDRQNGHAAPIEWVTEGLPDGMGWEAETSVVEGGEASDDPPNRGRRGGRRGRASNERSGNASADEKAKKVVATLTAECEPGHYAIRIQGRTGEESPTIPLQFRTAGVDYDTIWITVVP